MRGRHYILILAAFAALMPAEAFAIQQSTLSCNGASPSGNLFGWNPGGGTPQVSNIFSWIMHSFIDILDSVLKNVYCGMQYTMTTLLGALFTLYIVIFGAQLLMGTTDLTAKEFMTRMLKMAAIIMFATQSSYGIGLLFNFFVNFQAEAIGWVLESIPQTNPGSIVGGFDISEACNGGNSSGINEWDQYRFLDRLACNIIAGPFTQANSKVLGFFIALMVVLPPVFWLGAQWLWMNIKIVVSALVSYLLGLSALAFLITLSPIFLSLMLFKITSHFFQSWYRYMISYSLQIVVVFACIAMWLSVTAHFLGFFNNVSCMIFPYQKVEATGSKSRLNDSWALCPHTVTGNATEGPKAFCNGSKNDPYNYIQENHQPGCSSSYDPYVAGKDRQNLIPLSKLPQEADFIYYLVYHLTTLILVTYAFSALLKAAPKIAQQLAGPEYAPILGQGFGFTSLGQIKGITPDAFKSKDSGGTSGWRDKLGMGQPGMSAGDLIKSGVKQMVSNRPVKT